jgi:hypothetical protein
MNEAYEQELQQEIDFLYDELAYLQGEITDARKHNDPDEYARLFRVYLPLQKQYLKLCAESEKLAGAGVDELAAFNGA